MSSGSVRAWGRARTSRSSILAINCWLFLLYSALFRFTLVPPAVAAFGLITVLLHFTGIPLRSFLGLGPVAEMGMPVALSHLTLATWLVVKGFGEGPAPLR